MGFFDWIKGLFNSNEKEVERKTPPAQKKRPVSRSGDCRCSNCHTNFNYKDFIGLCTSQKCFETDTFVKSLVDLQFEPVIGPRQILLNESTAKDIDDINEEYPIEDVIINGEHKCPECGYNFFFYACPHCRHSIPRLTREDLNNTIAPAGIGASGKTVYMTVLIHQLLNNGIVKPDLKVISNFFVGDDFQEFRKKYDELFMRKTLFPPTLPTDIPRPYLLRTVTRETNKDDKKSYTLWYDFSGESFENESDKNAIVQYFSEVGGILLFIDPTNSNSVVKLLNVAPNADSGADAIRDQSVLQQLNTILTRAHEDEDAMRDKLFAIIVNKVDIFRGKGIGHFDEDSIIWQPSPHNTAGEFCVDDFNRVNKEVRNYAKEFHHQIYSQLVGLENSEGSNVGYFAVSSLGHPPAEGSYNLEQPIEPIRIEDPFYWMLYKMGHLPGTNRDNGDFFADSDEDPLLSPDEDEEFMSGKDSLIK